MNWKTRQSISRIVGVFNRNKGKVYEQDIEALKHVNNILEAETEQIVNDHMLFAKLLAYLMRIELLSIGDMKMVAQRLNDVLAMPLDLHLQMLHLKINENERRAFFDSLGFDTKAIGIHKDESALLKQHEKAIISKLKNEWSENNVRRSFKNTAEAMIKNINNYE